MQSSKISIATSACFVVIIKGGVSRDRAFPCAQQRKPLGETSDEVLEVMRDLRAHGVSIFTLGQYLRPSPKHLPIMRYVAPEEFAELKAAGKAMGFEHVEAGPLVRSSYHASEQV